MSPDCYIRISPSPFFLSIPLPRRSLRSRCHVARGDISVVWISDVYNIYYNNTSHNGFASYPGSVPNSGHQLDQRAPATSADISHTHPPARRLIAFLLLPRVPRVTFSSSLSLDHRASPWITAPLPLSLLPLLSFSFAFEWRAIELLRADKRETQFKLRLLAVVTTVIITLAFHGDSMHTCMGPRRQYVASSSKFTERSFLRSISPFIIRDVNR